MSSDAVVYNVYAKDDKHALQRAEAETGTFGVRGDILDLATVEQIEPEPEGVAVKWWCSWAPETGLNCDIADDSDNGGYYEWDGGGNVTLVNAAIESASEPTLAEFAAAVKDATSVEIPVPEEDEPQWWTWDTSGPDGPGYWRAASTCTVPQTGRYFTTVYGTTADRDAKRDALLEAARKAGKP